MNRFLRKLTSGISHFFVEKYGIRPGYGGTMLPPSKIVHKGRIFGAIFLPFAGLLTAAAFSFAFPAADDDMGIDTTDHNTTEKVSAPKKSGTKMDAPQFIDNNTTLSIVPPRTAQKNLSITHDFSKQTTSSDLYSGATAPLKSLFVADRGQDTTLWGKVLTIIDQSDVFQNDPNLMPFVGALQDIKNHVENGEAIDQNRVAHLLKQVGYYLTNIDPETGKKYQKMSQNNHLVDGYKILKIVNALDNSQKDATELERLYPQTLGDKLHQQQIKSITLMALSGTGFRPSPRSNETLKNAALQYKFA